MNLNNHAWFNGWRRYLIGGAVLTCVTWGFDFVNSAHTRSTGVRAISSLSFAAALLGAMLIISMIGWLTIRILKGKEQAADSVDTMLWSSCLLATAVSAVRMFQD